MGDKFFPLRTSDGVAPTEMEVKNELLAYWDAYSPLSLKTLYLAYDKGQTLGKVGVDSREARASSAKYNSLIVRGPGVGPLVTPTEAESWESAALKDIIESVTARSQMR